MAAEARLSAALLRPLLQHFVKNALKEGMSRASPPRILADPLEDITATSAKSPLVLMYLGPQELSNCSTQNLYRS